jgi:hypothetical protein
MALRYFTPGKQQMFSGYTPIPVDFYLQQLEKRDRAYETTSSMIDSTQNAYGGMDTRSTDVAGKNQLIEGYLGDIHKFVKEKYSGDYGKALTEVRSRLSKISQDPRLQGWTKALEDEKAYNKAKLTSTLSGKNWLENPSYNPSSEPVRYDERSGVVTTPDYSKAGMEQQKYDLMLQGTINKFNNAVNEGSIIPNGVQGMARRITTMGASESEIRKFVNENPDLVNMFVSETGNAFNWDPQFGGDMEKTKEFVISTLAHNVREGKTNQDFNLPTPKESPSKDDTSIFDNIFAKSKDYNSTGSKESNPFGLIDPDGKPDSRSYVPSTPYPGAGKSQGAGIGVLRTAQTSGRNEKLQKKFQSDLNEQNEAWSPWYDQYGKEYYKKVNKGWKNAQQSYSISNNFSVKQSDYVEKKLASGLSTAEFNVVNDQGKTTPMNINDMIKYLGLEGKNAKETITNTNQFRDGLKVSGMYDKPNSPYFMGIRAEYGGIPFVMQFEDQTDPIFLMTKELRDNKETVRTRQTKTYKLPGFKNSTVQGYIDIDPETENLGLQTITLNIDGETFEVPGEDYSSILTALYKRQQQITQQ